MMQLKSLYELLDLPPFYPTQEEIRTAYLDKIRYVHPDAGNLPEDTATEYTQAVNRAYAILSDPEKRREYDEALYQSRYSPYSDVSTQQQQFHKATSVKERRQKISFTTVANIITVIMLFLLPFFPLIASKISAPEVSLMQPNEAQSKPLPYNGEILYGGDFSEICGRLTIQTQGTKNYFIKLRDYNTNTLVISFFVRGGQSVDIDVPLGDYKLSYACGSTWYGDDVLFGAETIYAKADDVFSFEDYGDSTTWWTVELYPQVDGNLSTSALSPDTF